MRSIALLVMMMIAIPGLAQYGQEWEVAQDFYESGSLRFDFNHDGSQELTKHLANTITAFDGADEWSVYWYVVDESVEYLTIWDLYELTPGIEQALFIASNIIADTSLQLAAYNIQSETPEWTTPLVDGFFSFIDVDNLDDDPALEVVLGVNRYQEEDENYQSRFYIYDGATGALEYESAGYTGYMAGPYLGEMDNDNTMEILFNLYDYSTLLSTLHVFSMNHDQNLLIPLQANYFELISSNLTPLFPNAADVFGEVTGLQIVYSDNGSIYIPPPIDLNTIGEIDIREAYRVFCNEASELNITGAPVNPATPFTLLPGQWNWMGYPLQNPVPVETALEEIVDVVDILLDDDGNLWIPDLGLNTIGSLTPGTGYLVFVETTTTFLFHEGAGLRTPRNTPGNQASALRTGLPYAIIVTLDPDLQEQDPVMIRLFDGARIVGERVIEDLTSPIPVIGWQGSDEFGVPGYSPGHPVSVRLYDSTGEEIPFESPVDAGNYGTPPFSMVELNAVTAPKSFGLNDVYPNPFNSSVAITLSIPVSGEVRAELYNVLGERLFSRDFHLQAGESRLNLSGAGENLTAGSSMYFLRVEYNGAVESRKLLYLK